MKVQAFIKDALGNCSVPVDIHPHVLKGNHFNFFNYCYNVHNPAAKACLDSAVTDSSTTLWDPLGAGIKKPLLPGDLGLFTSDEVSEEDVQKAKDRIGVGTFPVWPPDLFAVTASLLEQSGAYQRMRPVDVRFRSNGSYERKEDWLKSCFEKFDWQGTQPLNPNDADIFGVCGVNRYVLRLIGLMWAHGALTILMPGDISNESSDQDIASALDKSIREQSARSNRALERFAKFFSNEIDEDLFSEFKSRLEKKITDAYLLERLKAKTKQEVHTTDFVTGTADDHEHIYSRYLTRAAINGTLRKRLDDDEFDPTEYNKNRRSVLSQQRVPGLLKILWAIDYIQNQWKIVSTATENLAPFNPNRLPVPGADKDTIRSWEWCRAASRLLIIADEASRAIGFSDRATGRAMSLGIENPEEHDPEDIVPGSSCKLVWEAFKKGYDDALTAYNASIEDGTSPLLPLLPRTLTRCFDDELGSVLPKARTSQVGCTIRSLTHNLALLPPRGRVRARWARSPSGAIRETLNILMVPFPYRLHTRDFRVSEVSKNDDAPWGSFKVNPGWIYEYDDELRPLVEIPIKNTARKDVSEDAYWRKPTKVCLKTGIRSQIFDSPKAYSDYIDLCHANLLEHVRSLTDNLPGEDVHAIVFPEAALTYEAYNYLAMNLAGTMPSLEIMVAGLCSAPKSQMALHLNPAAEEDLGSDLLKERISGNFVATYLQNPVPVRKANQILSELRQTGADDARLKSERKRLEKVMWPMRHIRGKHHRWCLDTRQLADYALSHRLRPNRSWWEDFDFLPREMLFCEFLSGSVLTALICEDLARIEPCQVALRAVGPNLVFVLLMDSAQVKGRWPHQYAGVLADDPGSSVLTLTSLGLIERSSKSRGYKSLSIGMWREPNGETREIELPKGYHAQLLTLRSEYIEERTLDSRSDNGDSAIVWRFAGLTPVKAGETRSASRGARNALYSIGKIDPLRAREESVLDSATDGVQTIAHSQGDENREETTVSASGTNVAADALPITSPSPPKFDLPN